MEHFTKFLALLAKVRTLCKAKHLAPFILSVSDEANFFNRIDTRSSLRQLMPINLLFSLSLFASSPFECRNATIHFYSDSTTYMGSYLSKDPRGTASCAPVASLEVSPPLCAVTKAEYAGRRRSLFLYHRGKMEGGERGGIWESRGRGHTTTRATF